MRRNAHCDTHLLDLSHSGYRSGWVVSLAVQVSPESSQLASRFEPQLIEDVSDVVGRGLLADYELLGNASVAEATCHQRGDLALPGRQRIGSLPSPGFRRRLADYCFPKITLGFGFEQLQGTYDGLLQRR